MSGPRSLLIMPANRETMLAKAATYAADALVFDLEDAVPVAEKAKARVLAREYIGTSSTAALVYARVNAPPSGMLEEDLDAIVVPGLVGIRVPKSESADDIQRIDALLTALERERGLPVGAVQVCPSLESAKGVWFAYEIASSSPRVRSIMCGTAENGDLQGDLGYTWTAEGEEKLYVRSRVLLAARAAGVEHVLDGAFSNVRDAEALRIDCEASRKLGYRGRSVIHPNQIETVNRVFMPTDQELDYQRRVVQEFDAAVARGSAAITVDGKLVDYAMAATARRVLAWAEGLTAGEGVKE